MRTLKFYSLVAACALTLPPLAARGDGLAPTPTNSVDLRPKLEKLGLTPRVQGSRGTCSVFVIAGALEFAATGKLPPGQRFSVEFLNWAANEVTGRPEDGSFFSDLWAGFAAHGICLESEMPYQDRYDAARRPDASAIASAKTRQALGVELHWIKRWNVNTGLSEAEFDAIKHTLHQGWPVCGGMRWPKKERWEKDVLGMCEADAVRDGHSVLLVGYRDDPALPGGGVFIIRNSGNGGRDGYLPYAFSRSYLNDAVWIGPSPAAEKPKDTPNAS